MSYSAQVFRILIASPSDVMEERDIAVKVIQEWNDLNSAERQLVLLPLRWETHSAPEYGKRPQEVINRQVVDQCDLLVGIFWTRIGSPTGVADSGTLEEIERVAKDGKPSMLYFSKANKNPDEIDLKQLEKLRGFKEKTFPNALVENYTNSVEFRDKLARQLEIQLRALLADAGVKKIDEDDAPFTDVVLNFADPQQLTPIGEKIVINATHLSVIDIDEVPDYEPKKNIARTKEREEIYEVVMGVNRRGKNYYRQKIESLILASKTRPLKFWLKNIGSVGARDVYIDIRFKSNGIPISLTKKPRSEWAVEVLLYSNQDDSGITKISDTLYSANIEMRALQPKREIIPQTQLHVGADADCIIQVEASIYADTLSEPILRKLEIEYKTKTVDTSYRNLLEELEAQEN